MKPLPTRPVGRFAFAPLLVALLLFGMARGNVRVQAAEVDVALATQQASMERYQTQVTPILKRYCLECHSGETTEGDLSLVKLQPDMKATTSAARWAMVVEKVTAREMPPKESTPLTDESRALLLDWIKAELKRSGKHLARRETYHNGNQISHHLLFDPQQAAPLDVPPRIRTVSPEIYDSFARAQAKGFENLVGQPFSPGVGTAFKDMRLPKMDEPVTAQLIRNALVIVDRQTSFRLEKGEMKPIPGTRKEFLPLVDEQNPLSDDELLKAIQLQFANVLQRKPDESEQSRFLALMKKNIADAGRLVGVRYTLAAVFLLPEAIFRYELGSNSLDDAGRVRLAPEEIAFALSFALTDNRPPGWLLDAAKQGNLDTQAGVADSVRQLLADEKLRKPRILRFFREYFGYAQAAEIFKEPKEMPGHTPKVLVEDTDRLIEYILEQDKQVLRELLTTNKAFVAYRQADEMRKKRADALAKFEADKKKNPEKFKGKMPRLPGRSIYESYNLEEFPAEQPVELPKDQRSGILTQPAWLVAWSTADDNHVILRGKWIRERLLGGVVPDIPITVDAQLPHAPEKTLRQRMAVTQEKYCWQCHQLMNRVGYPLEMYDHFGRFRTTEPVLDLAATAKHVDEKGKRLGDVMRADPVDASGGFEFTLDPKLHGDVSNGIEFLHKMAESEVVEQVFVRHAFRYWMGRNENLGDAGSLQAAHQAYRQTDGSMQAMIVSLLSSDSFLYRVPMPTDAKPAVADGKKSSAKINP